jgi:hypothetical protein
MSVVSGEKEGRKNLPVVVNNRAGRVCFDAGKKGFPRIATDFPRIPQGFPPALSTFSTEFSTQSEKMCVYIAYKLSQHGNKGTRGAVMVGTSKMCGHLHAKINA